jgi:SP family galactose:H+ symporter-like MFS transporter
MCFAGVGGVLYGYDIGVIAGALLFIQKDIHLSQLELSFIVAAVLGGGSVATLVSGFLADKFGRRKLILSSALIFIAGMLLLITANSYTMLLLGRLVQGVGVGIVVIVVPLYIVETMPAELRGRGITIFQAFLTAGILFAALVDLKFVSSGDWRSMFGFALIPGVVLFVGGLWLPESPRWLFRQGKIDLAKSALLKCSPHREAELDYSEMIQLDAQNDIEKQAKRSILHKQYLPPFLLALSIACLNQLTGINSLLQFSTYILDGAGIHSNTVAMLGTVGISLVNFVTTLIAFFLVDKIGRRPLMLFGTIGMTVALFALGCFAHFMHPSVLQGYTVIAGMAVYIFAFAIGPGVVVWLVLSELLPTEIRGSGMAICLFMNSLVSTVLASGFLSIASHFGYAGDFWICAVFTAIYFVVVHRFLPESKAKTLEEIEAEYKQKWLTRQ